MKKRTSDKFWFPFWVDKWIFGSIRIECTPAERGIWVDLLSLASKDDGHIRANEETPYPLTQLSGMLIIPIDELDAAIKKFIKMKKLMLTKHKTLYVTTHEKYQFSDRHKSRVKDQIDSHEDDIFNKTSIQCPSKFSDMAHKSGTVGVNRLIVAIIMDRSLKPKEEVHHINGKGNDNRPENLMLFADHADHGRYEYGYKITPIWDGSKISMTAKRAIVTKIKATILNNNKVNNNIKKNIKHSCMSKNKSKKKKPKKETVKIKKDGKEIDVSFDEAFDYWYKSYPKHVNRVVALEKFRARCRQGQFEEIDAGLTGYLNHIANELSRRGIELKEMMPYILYPQTFLNKDRWKEFIGVKRVANL